jgi:hypothetical protein
MPITPWPYYPDHPLALICRSRLGSYMPVGDTPFSEHLYDVQDAAVVS